MKITVLLKALFLFLILCVYGAFSTGTFTNKVSIENRTLASWNDLVFKLSSPEQFVSTLKGIFEDNFVFRAELIKIANFIDLNVFRANASGGFVIGKDGWEFYAGDENLEDQAGLRKLTGSQLYEISQNVQASLKQLDEQDITASVFVVPNKASIHREYLPEKFLKLGATTRAEQVLKLRNESPLLKNLILEKEIFLFNKKIKGFDIYEKKGSHWNDLGAFLGYQILLKNMGLTPRPLSDFNIFDLPDYCPLSSTYMPTFNNIHLLNSPVLISKNDRIFSRDLKIGEPDKITPKMRCDAEGQEPFRVCGSKNIQKRSLLVFGDSFSDKLLPFLCPHFSKVTFVSRRSIDHLLVKELEPDYVVHEISERFFSSVYLLPNTTLTERRNKKIQKGDFGKLKNNFKLTFADNSFKSNLENSLIIKAFNKNELDFQTKLRKSGLIASSLLQRGQVILDFARIEPKSLKVTINGEFHDVLASKSSTFGSNSSILSAVINGQEAKVSFNKNGIFVGGAVTNIPTGKIDLRGISKIELSVVGKLATLDINGKKYASWESSISSAPSRLLFGDFSDHSSRVFSFTLSELEILAEF